jgi:hypothetical protein
MTMRNDVILTLAQVLRGAAATDQAQRLEEEAFRPTLSPDALDAWLKGTLKAVEPRIKQYETTIGKKGSYPKGLPKKDDTTSQPAKKLEDMSDAELFKLRQQKKAEQAK